MAFKAMSDSSLALHIWILIISYYNCMFYNTKQVMRERESNKLSFSITCLFFQLNHRL